MEYIRYEQLELCSGLAFVAGTPSMGRRAIQIHESIERIHNPKRPINLFVQSDETTYQSLLYSLPLLRRIAELLCIQCVHFPNNIEIKGALQIVRYIYDVYEPHPVQSISLWIIIPLVCLVAIAILGFVIISVECVSIAENIVLPNLETEKGWLHIVEEGAKKLEVDLSVENLNESVEEVGHKIILEMNEKGELEEIEKLDVPEVLQKEIEKLDVPDVLQKEIEKLPLDDVPQFVQKQTYAMYRKSDYYYRIGFEEWLDIMNIKLPM